MRNRNFLIALLGGLWMAFLAVAMNRTWGDGGPSIAFMTGWTCSLLATLYGLYRGLSAGRA